MNLGAHGTQVGTSNSSCLARGHDLRCVVDDGTDSQSTKSSPLLRPLACISLASASALAFIMKTLAEEKKKGQVSKPSSISGAGMR